MRLDQHESARVKRAASTGASAIAAGVGILAAVLIVLFLIGLAAQGVGAMILLALAYVYHDARDKSRRTERLSIHMAHIQATEIPNTYSPSAEGEYCGRTAGGSLIGPYATAEELDRELAAAEAEGDVWGDGGELLA